MRAKKKKKKEENAENENVGAQTLKPNGYNMYYISTFRYYTDTSRRFMWCVEINNYFVLEYD